MRDKVAGVAIGSVVAYVLAAVGVGNAVGFVSYVGVGIL